MLTHNGECLQQREQILQKEVSCFPIYTYTVNCQLKRGSSILLYCVRNYPVSQRIFDSTVADKSGGHMFFLF